MLENNDTGRPLRLGVSKNSTRTKPYAYLQGFHTPIQQEDVRRLVIFYWLETEQPHVVNYMLEHGVCSATTDALPDVPNAEPAAPLQPNCEVRHYQQNVQAPTNQLGYDNAQPVLQSQVMQPTTFSLTLYYRHP